MNGNSTIEHAGLSDVGVRRSNNQDSFAVLPAADAEQWQARGHVFLVADGMGAHAVGELASKLAADSIPHIYSKYAQEGPVAALRKAFVETNLTIHTRGQQNRDFEGMGTTGTALLLRPEGAWVAHVGDSRAYRVRGQRIEQMTFDHSLVWEMARRQGISPEDLQGVPSNVIVRSLGPEPFVQVDIEGPHPIEPGDIFVLCSDGLSGQVSDADIGAVVSALPAAEACRVLVDLANLQGGPDNITVVIVRTAGASGPAAGGPIVPVRTWPAWLPWPLVCLIAGLFLTLGAIALSHYHLPGKVPVFVLAAVALLSGLAGLLLQHQEERRQHGHELPRPPPHVYRAVDCTVTPDVLERLAKAETVLEGRLRDNRWDADWPSFRRRQELGQEALAQGDLLGAFRAHCRAITVLAEAFQRQRGSEGVFRPVWDRTPR